ncbi:hypothetical protein [Spirillospora sp. CA-294931]|uniref:hypothetical protein n=1 Tax=Spirillospora sp. CA-294931 TaxID=3240042 RepID=UPI003D8FD268
MEIFEVSVHVNDLIEELLPRVNPDARFDRDLAEVQIAVGGFVPRAGTWGILERCAREPRESWPSLVEDWLRDLSDSLALAITELDLMGDVRELCESFQDLLRVRVVPKLTEAEREGMVVIAVGRYFDAVVVIDLPHRPKPLSRDLAALMGMNRRLGSAVTNTHDRLADVRLHEMPLTMTESVRVVSQPGSRYVSALLTEVHRFLPDAGGAGALLALPSHSTMLLYPIGSAPVSEVLPVFFQVARDMHAASDDSCTPKAYWWRPGKGLIELDPAVPPSTLAAPSNAPARRHRRRPLRRRRSS